MFRVRAAGWARGPAAMRAAAIGAARRAGVWRANLQVPSEVRGSSHTLAEREGFEPSKPLTGLNGFRDRPVQPLRHLSAAVFTRSYGVRASDRTGTGYRSVYRLGLVRASQTTPGAREACARGNPCRAVSGPSVSS
jgi:hypothetical protein